VVAGQLNQDVTKGRRSRRRAAGNGLALALVLSIALAAPASGALPDGRGWEMVSPVDKNGGQADPTGTLGGGGVLEAASQGGAVTYSSATAFGPDAVGSPPASQYVVTRGGGGWQSENVTVPTVSGGYRLDDQGVPYQLFSPDLVRALLFNGDHCRGDMTGCPVANPPLAGTDAPVGYQDYYLLEAGSFEALVGAADVAGHSIDPAEFNLRLVGASPDLRSTVLSTCSQLTSEAVDGCDAAEPNIYRWRQADSAPTLVNTSPGAVLAAPAGAVSADGGRVYYNDTGSGELRLYDAGVQRQVDEDAGEEGIFQAASQDGSIAYFTTGAGHLWRYSATTDSASDLTPAGGVVGVLGVSASGSDVYFQDGGGLKLWSEGTVTTAASGGSAADQSTYPAATGAARVSADGSKLLFVSKSSLTGYDNTDKITGLPDLEVFLYDAAAPKLICISCNPFGKRPIGPSTIPGAASNGTAPGTVAYKPRVLSGNGRRVFLNSTDALAVSDSNSKPATGAGVPDVYQWEAQGEGGCAVAAGCTGILSNGSLPDGAIFADAAADGADAFFLTEASLVPADPGSIDLYDARIGGGFPEPNPPIPCEGDACQVLPPVPAEPTLATQEAGLGNPPVVYRKYCRRGYVKRKGICLKKRSHRRGHRHGRSNIGAGR